MSLYDDIEREAFQDLRNDPRADWWTDERPTRREAERDEYEAHRARTAIMGSCDDARWESHQDYIDWMAAHPEEPF